MNTSNLRRGQRVKCNVRGRVFWATYLGDEGDGTHQIKPPRGISYHYITGRQIESAEKGYDPYDKLVRRSS